MSEQLKTMNIKGKPYVLVNERIKAFRNKYDGWSLESEVLEMTNERCVIRAIIKDDKGVIRATGIAYETANSTYINKTSYIENCETSAWGRALGNLGIGIDTSIASAEEIQNAVNNQKDEPPFPEVSEKISDDKVKQLNGILTIFPKENRETVLNLLLIPYEVKEFKELTVSQFVKVRNELIDRAEKMKSERLNNMIKQFASKSGKSEGEAKIIIETVIEKPINDVTIAEFAKYAKQVKQMIDDLSADDE